MAVERALDVLGDGESSIVLFTRGLHYQLYSVTGEGWSGYWEAQPDEHSPIDKVVIYDRKKDLAKIYVAKYLRSTPAVAPHTGRTVVHFRDAKFVGTTWRKWNEFTSEGQTPVRYLTKNR